MKRISWYLSLIGLAGIAVLGVIYFITSQANMQVMNLEGVETQPIIIEMEKGYDALAYIHQTDDPSKLSEIFVDSPDYKSSAEAKKDVEEIFCPEVAERAGYLTAMKAKTIAYGRVNADMRTALEKARAENREITHEEYQAIIKKNNGLIPPSNPPTGKGEIVKSSFPLKFDKIIMMGDHATVYYDDGAAYQKAILVKIDGIWFIAGIEPIHIHF